jgi:hypothetical protein
LSAISEPSKSRSIGINDPERLENEGEMRTVIKEVLVTGTLSSGVYGVSSLREDSVALRLLKETPRDNLYASIDHVRFFIIPTCLHVLICY